MFEKVVILSKIKIPHLTVNSLLLVSNEIVDSHFVYIYIIAGGKSYT